MDLSDGKTGLAILNKGGDALLKTKSFLEIRPRALQMTALKQCEARETLVFQLFNLTNREINGEIVFAFPFTKVWQMNLTEEQREELELVSGKLRLKVPKKKIMTLEFAYQIILFNTKGVRKNKLPFYEVFSYCFH